MPYCLVGAPASELTGNKAGPGYRRTSSLLLDGAGRGEAGYSRRAEEARSVGREGQV